MAGKVKEPGMDEGQAQKDRAGFRTTVENLTGGTVMDAGDGGSAEVGNQYDTDPLGEERDDSLTYGSGTSPKK
jgi:hypothetical protein